MVMQHIYRNLLGIMSAIYMPEPAFFAENTSRVLFGVSGPFN